MSAPAGLGVVAGAGNAGPDVLMRVTATCPAAVTLAGPAAAPVLLPRRTPLWCGVAASAVLTAAVLVLSGRLLAIPLVLAGAALGFLRCVGRGQAGSEGAQWARRRSRRT
ncbi:hypothetical protein ACGF4C_29020 [Streptomyces sp. NPDC048197]|uniref:hypothetical protein n=1 Tax=Streptomyces sp. NPDC048197 TaxID=3365511 RepID=UPI003715C465